MFVFLPGGYYCPGGGIITPALPCSAGYYCRQGAISAAPLQDSNANECPVGFYCPEQSTEPVACPVGTFSNTLRLHAEGDCTDCTPGNTQSVQIQTLIIARP